MNTQLNVGIAMAVLLFTFAIGRSSGLQTVWDSCIYNRTIKIGNDNFKCELLKVKDASTQ